MTNITCFSMTNNCDTDNSLPDFPRKPNYTYFPRSNLIPLQYAISERVNSFSKAVILNSFYELVMESKVSNRLLMTDCDLDVWERGYIGIPDVFFKEEPIYVAWDTMSENDIITRILGQIPVTQNKLEIGKKYAMYPYPDRKDQEIYAVGINTVVGFSGAYQILTSDNKDNLTVLLEKEKNEKLYGLSFNTDRYIQLISPNPNVEAFVYGGLLVESFDG